MFRWVETRYNDGRSASNLASSKYVADVGISEAAVYARVGHCHHLRPRSARFSEIFSDIVFLTFFYLISLYFSDQKAQRPMMPFGFQCTHEMLKCDKNLLLIDQS